MVGRRTLPNNCHDWQQELIQCAEAQYDIRVLTHKKDFAHWMIARDLLKASQNPVYIQPTGADKGLVMGIPEQINSKVHNFLLDVVYKRRLPVDPDKDLLPMPAVDANGVPVPAGGHAQIEDTILYHTRGYQDSKYAVLASMYTQLQPDVYKQLTTTELQRGMSKHTNHPIVDNFRTGDKGAFRCIKELVLLKILMLHKPRGNNKNYTLTPRGLRLCYHLFHVKFDPSASAAYKRVRPVANCVATADGSVVPADSTNTPNTINAIPTNNAANGNTNNATTGKTTTTNARSTVGEKKRPRDWGSTKAENVIEIDDCVEDEVKEEVKSKRLRHFDHLAGAGSGGGSASSTVGKTAIPVTDVKTDSQAELEDAQLQSILAYSEEQARHEAAARAVKRERELDEEQALQLAIAQSEAEAEARAVQELYLSGMRVPQASTTLNTFTTTSSTIHSKIPSCTSSYDSDSGSDVDSDDEDFKRALAESLLISGSSSVRSSVRPTEASQMTTTKATPNRVYISLDDSQEEESQEEVVFAGSSTVKPVITINSAAGGAGGSVSGSSAHSPRFTNSTVDTPFRTTTQHTGVIDVDAASPKLPTPLRTQPTPLPTGVVVEIDDSQPLDDGIYDTTAPSTPRAHDTRVDVMELDTTPSPVRTSPTALPRILPMPLPSTLQEVITLDDSQSQPLYDDNDYNYTSYDNNSTMEVEQVVDSQGSDDVVYVPDPVIRNTVYTSSGNSNGSSNGGSGSIGVSTSYGSGVGTSYGCGAYSSGSKARAMLAAYATSTVGTAGDTNSNTTNSNTTHKPIIAPSSSTNTTPSTTTTSSTITLPAPPSLTATLYPQPHPIATTTVPFIAQHKVALLLDIRERATQAYYKKFLFEIQDKCKAHLGSSAGGSVEWSAEQQKLRLGDIAFAYEHTTTNTNTATNTDADTTTHYLTGVIIERKTTNDLISRSTGDSRARGGTAPHMVQECRLRNVSSVYSSVSSSSANIGGSTCTSTNRSNCYMLIEGNITTATIHSAPLVYHDSDLNNPDVIDSMEGIVNYMCSVVARNSALNKVRVLQTVNNSATCLLLAAMLAVEVYTAEQSNSAYINNLVNNNARNNTPSTNANTNTATTRNNTTTATPSSTTVLNPNTTTTTTTTTTATTRLTLPTKVVVDKYCGSFGASVQGKEAAMRRALEQPVLVPVGAGTGASDRGSEVVYEVVSAEMVERLVRRFGCWDALLHMYKQCYTTHMGGSGSICADRGGVVYGVDVYSGVVSSAEARCALMLCELTVGGTQSDRDTITTSTSNTTSNSNAYTLDDSQETIDSPTNQTNPTTGNKSSTFLKDSLLVWQHARALLMKEGFLQYISNTTSTSTTSGSSSSNTTLSPSITRYFQSLHTTLQNAKPCKMTHVTMSNSISTGVMSQYATLGTVKFVCTVLPTTPNTNSTTSSTTDNTGTITTGAKRRKADTTIGGSSTYLNCTDGKYPYMCIQSIDSNTHISGTSNGTVNTSSANTITHRCSLRTVVAVVSPLDVVEALVFATQAYKEHDTPPVGSGSSGGSGSSWGGVSVFADSGRCVEVVMMAVALLLPRLPAEFNTTGTSTTATSTTTTTTSDNTTTTATAPTQCVLVVEGLVHPTSPSATAMGKLQTALNKHTSGSGSSVGAGGSTSGVGVGVGRPLLPVVEAREVSANHLWLVQLFIAVVSMRGSGGTSSSNTGGSAGVAGWQCFTTNGDEQTERFLYALIHETHRQVLLLF